MKMYVLLLIVLLLVIAPMYAYGEGAERNAADEINLDSLIISIDNEVIYDSARVLPPPAVQLKQNSTMSFNLRWVVKGEGSRFGQGDHFTIPVVYVDKLRLTEPFVQALELETDDGQKVAVAEGRFSYIDGLLAFQVVFNGNAAHYQIEGGPAGGYAELNLDSGQTILPLTFGNDQTVTVDIETKPGAVIPQPSLPGFPSTLPSMGKAVFSPQVDGNTVNLLTRYPTMQSGEERKFGLDWRLTFFDLTSHFQGGGGTSENVIIEDVVGEGQQFTNFASFAPGDRDKGFSSINDEDYEAPFFIEIPIVAVGSNRIYNLYGGDTLSVSNPNVYITTLIRANQLRQISGGDLAAQVRQQPLTWGIEKLGDGREMLIINLGRLGPGVASGQGLTADMVREKEYPYNVLDGVIVKELLSAQRMIESGSAETEQWKRVRRENLGSILYYWPGYRDKLCAIAGIPAGSGTEALEAALFAMPCDQLQQSGITTLGYDERRAGGIAGSMRIDSFVLRYRTGLASVTDTDISNNVKVLTGLLNKEDSASYRHQFYAGISGTVNVGEVGFIKVDAADGIPSGEIPQAEIANILGLADAEFEVYEAEGGPPLRFTRDGNVYKLQAGGNVMVLRSDDAGTFKITGLSPAKKYALYETKAPAEYQLPDNRYTIFRVSNDASRYYLITNKKIPTGTETSSKPGNPDKPDTDRPNIEKPDKDQPDTDKRKYDIPDTDVPTTDKPSRDIHLPRIPKTGDEGNLHMAKTLMLAATAVIALAAVSHRNTRKKRPRK